jgi:hypothetical protein
MVFSFFIFAACAAYFLPHLRHWETTGILPAPAIACAGRRNAVNKETP